MGKEMINEVEFLIKMLEEEWSVSKEIKEKVVIDRIEAERFIRSAAWVADEVKKYIDKKGEELEFEEYVRMMKQSWVLFRGGKKICDEIKNVGLEDNVMVEVDDEEIKLIKIYNF